MTTNIKHGIVLRHPKLSHTGLIDLLTQHIPDGQTAWYFTTRITDTCFDVFEKAMVSTLVTAWSHGRVFCATCEIRWQRATGTVQNDVLVLSEDPISCLEGFQPIGIAWQVVSTGEQARLKAWGSLVPGTPNMRAEGRLPKRLRYPSGCQAGQLFVLYYCTPSGEVQFMRLTGVA
jgi:hypothetical protein